MDSNLNFIVREHMPNKGKVNSVYLLYNNWDDYGFKTSFNLHFIDNDSNSYYIGVVKIADSNSDSTTTNLPSSPFHFLSENYYSLGQSATFYEELMTLPFESRNEILNGLNDICYKEDLYHKYKDEHVVRASLMRGTDYDNIKKYRDILRGDAEATEFYFNHIIDAANAIEFNIIPSSFPPSNVHAIIGRNGVGKSHLLKKLVNLQSKDSNFTNTIHIILSIFDSDEDYCIENDHKKILGIVSPIAKNNKTNGIKIKDKNKLAEEFYNAFKECSMGLRKERLLKIYKIFEYDELLNEFDIFSLIENPKNKTEVIEKFKNLSSGHAIVLLILTQLIDLTEEKTLIVLDEPESHLHPPLLSAFIRALAMLVRMRNAVVLCATHSPIVLQEIPRSCIWKMNRNGNSIKTERPNIETFGENVSTLTQEVFALEVDKVGYYTLLEESVTEYLRVYESYPRRDNKHAYNLIMNKFNNQIGFEGQLILSNLISSRLKNE